MQPDNLSKKYEQLHLKAIKRYQKQVQESYYRTIEKIFKNANVKLKNKTFKLSDYPVLNKQVEKALLEFKEDLTVILVNGTKQQWGLADTKMDEILSTHYAGKQISEQIKSVLYGRNEKALEAFTQRKLKGLNLSDRVWKYTNQFRNEIEQGLYLGISDGTPSAVMAREQKQFLQQPDKLFRRVRDSAGKLVLSKVAKEYHPCRGVYRSSFKNAFRLTRTEVNDSYRSADFQRWSTTPFVIGIDVKLSNNHPKYDICDSLVGPYPAAYKHRGFHPQCLCFAVPRLALADDFDKYEDAILAGRESGFKFSGTVQHVPASATKWVNDNKEMLNRLKSKPYFLLDNKKFLPNIEH